MTDIDDHCRAAKAHIEKGDKAKDKAEQHYNSASQHIAAIHELTPDKAVFLEIVKLRIGIGKSRTYEMLAIGQGKKTDEDQRAESAERKARERANLSVTSRTEPEDDDIPPFLDRITQRNSEPMSPVPALLGDNFLDDEGDYAPVDPASDVSTRIRGFLYRANQSERGASIDDLGGLVITQEMRTAAAKAASAWTRICQLMEDIYGKGQAA